MKQIVILRMRPGADVQKKALELFLEHGPTGGTEWVLAGADSTTYVALGSLDDLDLAGVATFAPYFDVETIPVVEIDDEWTKAMQEAVKRQA